MPYKFYKHPILQRHSSTGLWKSIILFTCRTFAASGPILGCTYFLAYPTYYILKLHSNKSNIHVNCKLCTCCIYVHVCKWILRWNFVLLLGSSHKINGWKFHSTCNSIENAVSNKLNTNLLVHVYIKYDSIYMTCTSSWPFSAAGLGYSPPALLGKS